MHAIVFCADFFWVGSYWNQVTVQIKGKTECYECQPKPAPKTYPVCTITSTPSKVFRLSCTIFVLPLVNSYSVLLVLILISWSANHNMGVQKLVL